jgi:hypothetical protein
MKKTCLLPALVLLVAVTVGAERTQKDVSTFLNWYRNAHGAGQLTNTLDRKAYEATQAVCKYGWDHHVGTEAEQASLFASTAACNSDQEASEIEALQEWYSECPDYYGQGFSQSTGHFTHMVWKSCKTYGIWAQTCDVPGTSLKCVVALKTDCAPNVRGSFDQNIGNIGQCTNVKAPWEGQV